MIFGKCVYTSLCVAARDPVIAAFLCLRLVEKTLFPPPCSMPGVSMHSACCLCKPRDAPAQLLLKAMFSWTAVVRLGFLDNPQGRPNQNLCWPFPYWLVRISGSFLIFPAIAVLSAHLLKGIKALRSLRKERKNQKSSLICKEKVNKDWPIRVQVRGHGELFWIQGVFSWKTRRIDENGWFSRIRGVLRFGKV